MILTNIIQIHIPNECQGTPGEGLPPINASSKHLSFVTLVNTLAAALVGTMPSLNSLGRYHYQSTLDNNAADDDDDSSIKNKKSLHKRKDSA